MVQLSVNADDHRDEVKKPPEPEPEPEVEAPMLSKPADVKVQRARRGCPKTAIFITVVSIVIVLTVAAVLLGVFLSRPKWEDQVSEGSDSHEWDDSHSGEDSDSGSHGNSSSHGSHGGHRGGHRTGGHSGGNNDHGGHSGDHDHGGHGGEDDDDGVGP